MSEPLLQVENLVRHYQRPKKRLFGKKPIVEALNGVSFRVDVGESFGIVGESGSGKSTLARALLALEEPTAGRVTFKGKNLFALPADERRAMRRHIQMVFQDPFGSLDPKHRVRSIVTEPLDMQDDIRDDEREARAAEALTSVGLQPGDLDKYPHEFSGGQRQRIAIARALITKPQLIVADEPVSALDVSVQAQVLNLMMDLQERFGLTYVIISHDLAVVRHVTDRLAVMEAGLIVEQGDTGDIFDRPRHPYTRTLLDSVLDIPMPESQEDTTTVEQKPKPEPEPIAAAADSANEAVPVATRPSSPSPMEGVALALTAAETMTVLVSDDVADPSTPPLIPGKAGDHRTSTTEPVKPEAESGDVADPSTPPLIPGDDGDDRPPTTESAKPEAESDDDADPSTPPLIPGNGGDDRPPTSESAKPEEESDDDTAPSPPLIPRSKSKAPPSTTASTEPKEEEQAMIEGRNLVNGRWQDASEDRLLPVINPSDGQTFGHIARGTADDVDQAVKAAQRAMAGPWGRMPAFERGRILARLAGLVLKKVDHLTTLEARDVGKPLRQARADAVALARYFEFYGGAADKIHGETIPYHDGYTVLTLREPHGVTGHIVPWNYPMQIIGRSVGAALAMGNACVLKPGEDASLTALEIGRLALDAGLPPGVLNIVTGLGEEAGAALSAHPGIDHMSFTGSVQTGKLVQQAAASHSCPVTLELGGKSPQIVFADADLDQAIPFLVNASIQNAGQTCSAGSRVLIQDWIYDELAHRLAERFEKLDVGPADRDMDCGPVINPAQKRRVEGYLLGARADRIDVLGEGEIAPDTPAGGYYVKPTLLGNVAPDHALAQEEVFGPVLTAIRFANEEDAIRIANGGAYGLVAGVWTKDGARQMRLARAIKSGQVFINNYGAGGGVELPFGGVKSSGFGREKGFEALYGFSTLKTVAIRHG